MSKEKKIEIFKKTIIENTYDNITDDKGHKMIKIIKNIIKYSDIDIKKYHIDNLNYYNTEKIKELYIDIVHNVNNKKILIKNIVNVCCDNNDFDYYVNVIKNDELELHELKLLLTNFNTMDNIKKNLSDKIKNYNLNPNHYIKIDLNGLSEDELKIVYHVIIHNICYQALVCNK